MPKARLNNSEDTIKTKKGKKIFIRNETHSKYLLTNMFRGNE